MKIDKKNKLMIKEEKINNNKMIMEEVEEGEFFSILFLFFLDTLQIANSFLLSVIMEAVMMEEEVSRKS